MKTDRDLGILSDGELIDEVKRLARGEADATADLIASLAELDSRRLYLGEGCSSLFAYCTRVLHLSEHAAYHRIEVARAARRFPLVLQRVRSREVTLTAVSLLAPHLTEANHGALLDAARHQAKRAVEELVAALRPKPDVTPSVRKAPDRRTTDTPSAATDPAQVIAGLAPTGAATVAISTAVAAATPTNGGMRAMLTSGAAQSNANDRRLTSTPTEVRPLSPGRYHLHVTVPAETRDKLRRAQALLRHVVPDGDLAVVVDRALTALLEQLERRKMAARKAQRPDHERRKMAATKAQRRDHERREAARDAAAEAPHGTGTEVPASRQPPESGEVKEAPCASRTRGRYVPADVRRAVWARDQGRCTFVGSEGRCDESAFLELHHRVPFAAGGVATAANLALLCRAHNGHEAETFFSRRGADRGESLGSP